MKLLQKIRAAKDLSRSHLLSLISDFKSRGEEQFLALADQEFAPKSRKIASQKTAPDDAVLSELKKLQKKTMQAKPFVEAVINKANEQQIRLKAGAKPTSMPKLLEYFRSSASDEKLISIATAVYQENTRAHTSFRGPPR